VRQPLQWARAVTKTEGAFCGVSKLNLPFFTSVVPLRFSRSDTSRFTP
jgi:hypothetical protein